MQYEDFYSIEERERQIAQLKEKLHKGKRQRKRLKKSTLGKSATVKTLIMREDLEQLAQDTYGNPVISLYLNVTPDKLIRRGNVFLSVFHSLKEAEMQERQSFIARLTHNQRETLKADLREIAAFLDTLDTQYTKSVILFKSGKELHEVVKLPVSVRDVLAIDVDPYIVPLQVLLEEYKKILVVDVAKERSFFSTYQVGYTEDIGICRSFVPSDTVDKSIPGKVQRKRLTHLQAHLRKTALLAQRYFADYACSHIVVYGVDHALIAEFTGFLRDDLRQNIIAQIALSPHSTKNDLYHSIEKAIEAHRAQREEAEFAALSRYQADGGLVFGLSEVLDAMSRFLVRKLVIDGTMAEPGFMCKPHQYLTVHQSVCPYCKREVLPVKNIVDELLELALLHKIEIVTVVKRGDLLQKYSGIAAYTYQPTR